MSYGEDFPWIKFAILSILFIVPIVMFAPGLKWKILFTICVPVGVGLALAGKSMGGYGLAKKF